MRFKKTLIGLAVLTACSAPATRMVSSWKDPGTTQVHFDSIALIAVTDNAEIRQEAEDQLARLIPRSKASHFFIGPDVLKDPMAARNKLHTSLFDGAVILRLISQSEEVTYVASSPFSEFNWSAYDWDKMGTAVKQKTAVVETRLYSIKDNKLIWSGRSRTVEPTSLRKALPQIVTAAAERMRQDGLIVTPTPTP